MRSLPTRIDRYPAKMVSRLAAELIDRYTNEATSVLDPFCGSGAILVAAQRKGLTVSGVDLNPYAILLSEVKLTGFSASIATELLDDLVSACKRDTSCLRISWDMKHYWFTAGTLEKYERLRFHYHARDFLPTPEGKAVLLALALSARLCSRADPRSPKPFISKTALIQKRGRHLDPYRVTHSLLKELGDLYGAPRSRNFSLMQFDFRKEPASKAIGLHSHVITSPPYINAQDYFRNFKLELYLLEGLLPFSVDDLKNRFIGTERGLNRTILNGDEARLREERIPILRDLRLANDFLACVVHRYMEDMSYALNAFRVCLRPGGLLVMVCGDNLVGGFRLRTWEMLSGMAECAGFRLIDRYGDVIQNRSLPPQRLGHKGLIKEEIISAFALD